MGTSKEEVKYSGIAIEDDAIRELLLELAGEDSTVWPERGLYDQLNTLRQSYRHKELELPRDLEELTRDPRWIFLFMIIRDPALWQALLAAATDHEASQEEKIRRIQRIAKTLGLTLDDLEADWFTPLPAGPDDDWKKIAIPCPS